MCSTSFGCENCKKRYKCKRVSSKKKNQIKESNDNEVPQCSSCNQRHWRCESKKCTNCCKIYKCKELNCQNCIDDNIECKRPEPYPTTMESFNKLSNVSYLSYQLEDTEDGKIHTQAYHQYSMQKTFTNIKETFGDNAMIFPKNGKTWGTSKEARDYSIKEYNRCKQHSKCKCDYFDLTKICELCTNKCIRRKARIDGPPEIVGPFEFGDFRNIDQKYKSDKICEELEEYKKQTSSAIMEIWKNQIPYDEIIRNPKSIPPVWYSNPFSAEKVTRDQENLLKSKNKKKNMKVDDFDNVPSLLQEWKRKNIDNKPTRPKSLLLIGKTRIGKTEWARSLGEHVYWNGTYNLAKWDDDAEYIILDDWKWSFNKGDYTSSKVDMWKSIIGCQREFELHDKFMRKRTCYGPKPCIILCNNESDPRIGMDYELKQWFCGNVIIIELFEKLYKDNDSDDDNGNLKRKRNNNDGINNDNRNSKQRRIDKQ
jgi:hypothetical protein